MKVGKLDHLGIAVHSLSEALPTWLGLGFRHVATEKVASQKVEVAVLDNGFECVELLQASEATSPIAKFLKKRGPGLHHTCFRVPFLDKALDELKGKGYCFVTREAFTGADGCPVIFLHPSSCGGLLLELKEKP
jgi:methylmalonyl-CoA/ethylmalonyl-CoA epimerase